MVVLMVVLKWIAGWPPRVHLLTSPVSLAVLRQLAAPWSLTRFPRGRRCAGFAVGMFTAKM